MKTISLGFAFALSATLAQADATQTAMVDYVNQSVRGFFDAAATQAAVRNSNILHAGLSEAEILDLDTAWRSEIGQSPSPTIDAVVTSEVSRSLRGFVDRSEGRITEIILMDSRGMNVAVSDITSDFWQGDEAKYQETYLIGADAVHVGDVELDESSQTYQAQVSFVVTDPQTDEPIGAVTVGLNAAEF